eukprot:SAG31_NODE_28245_length_413_cov_0.821656_1_plen_45_part_10
MFKKSISKLTNDQLLLQGSAAAAAGDDKGGPSQKDMENLIRCGAY